MPMIRLGLAALLAVEPIALLAGPGVVHDRQADSLLAEARKKAQQSRVRFDKVNAASPADVVLQVEPASKMEAVYTETLTFPKLLANEWTVVGPRPVDLLGQRHVVTA